MMPSRLLTISPTKIANNKTKAIWLWQSERVSQDPDNVINICLKAKINQLYVPYDLTKATMNEWKNFIYNANKKGIKVHSLYGDPNWALTSYRNNGLAKINDVINYNSQVNTYEKFEGVHYDVEAYLVNQWSTDTTNVIRQWVDNMQAFANASRNAGLIFGGAFPFWLDTSDTVINNLPSEYTKGLHQIFIDMVDYYAIMSYRDTSSEIISVATNEVNYASSPKIIVSVETTKQEPSYITFYEEGYLATETAILEVDNGFSNRVGYKGIAIHDFKQYEIFLTNALGIAPSRTLTPSRTINII